MTILEEFFNFYFKAVNNDVLNIYKDLLQEKRGMAKDYEAIFSRNDNEAISFLLKFYRETGELCRKNPEQAILFNVHNNVCFPFFVNYIWQVINNEQKSKVIKKLKAERIDEITRILNENLELRNWFRHEIGLYLSQEDLFTLNEVIALQNFSSGGEYSFLNFAYPYLKDVEGKVLDAGCGSGFATLLMSQHLKVYSIDACKARLERAMALSSMMKKGETEIFSQVIDLIEKELGDISVYCNFPSAEKLLSGKARDVFFTEGSLEELPYDEDFFDFINCLDVLEHTYCPEDIIKQFARVVKAGGKVFITAPTRYGEVEQRIHENIEGTLFPAMLHMHHFEPSSLSSIFTTYGFKEIEMTPFDFMKWDEFMDIAEKSPARDLAEELKKKPFDEVALQLFAVYEKV